MPPHFPSLPPFVVVPLVEWQMRRENRRYHCQNPPIRRKRAAVDPARRVAFDALWQAALARGAPNALIDYDLPYPKIEFLHYLCDDLGLVAHGSNFPDLDALKPVRMSQDTSEFGNRMQIFASPDAVWAAWFAVTNKKSVTWTNNACVRVGPYGGAWTKLYYFNLTRDLAPGGSGSPQPYTDGMMYIARAGDFPDHHPTPQYDWLGIEVEEWGSTRPVTPLARLPFKPADFPYLERVEFVLGK